MRRKATVQSALGAMQAGARLTFTFKHGRPIWTLDDGTQLAAGIGVQLVNLPQIIPCDPGLFDGAPPQRFCQVNADREKGILAVRSPVGRRGGRHERQSAGTAGEAPIAVQDCQPTHQNTQKE